MVTQVQKLVKVSSRGRLVALRTFACWHVYQTRHMQVGGCSVRPTTNAGSSKHTCTTTITHACQTHAFQQGHACKKTAFQGPQPALHAAPTGELSQASGGGPSGTLRASSSCKSQRSSVARQHVTRDINLWLVQRFQQHHIQTKPCVAGVHPHVRHAWRCRRQ